MSARRPRSVTLISIILFIGCGIGIANVLLSPDWAFIIISFPQAIQQAFEKQGLIGCILILFDIIALIVGIISPIGIIIGVNWVRWLYIIWTGIHMISLWLLYGATVSFIAKIGGFGIWVIFAYYLTRPDASAFFYSKRSMEKEKNQG